MEYLLRPVGRVVSPRTDPQETDHWGAVESTVVIDDRLPDDCLRGLEEFSHAELVLLFDRFPERTEHRARAPRGRDDLPTVGVFADRSPRHPNRLGVSTCRIVAVRDRALEVRGLDAVDGTPVLDVKPVMSQHLPSGITQPRWVDELLTEYHRP